MKYTVENKLDNEAGSRFLDLQDWLAIFFFALIGLSFNSLPYSNKLSILGQAGLLGLIFIIYRKRPAMIIVAYILLTILPLRLFAGFSETGQGIYTLNPKILVAFAVFFMLYELIIVKRRYQINLLILAFVIFMICSLAWTVSLTSYDYHFRWLCTAYLFFPLLIREDQDIRAIIAAYIIAVDIFCIRVLPILTAETNLYRGSIKLDPNYAAFFVILSVALILVALTQYKSLISFKIRVLFIASAVLGGVTMAAFASRSSFVVLALLVVIYLLFNLKHVKTLLMTVIGVLALAVLLNQYGVFDPVLMRFANENVSTGGGRIPIQMELLKSVYYGDVGRFFLGNGYLTASNFGLGQQAHNSYVSILVGLGLVGLLIYLAYLLEMFARLRNRSYRPFLILFYFLIIYSLTLEPYHIPEGLTAFCLLSGVNAISTIQGMPKRDPVTAGEGKEI